MDCQKVGDLILQLRKENKMTQKQLADKMNISDKTVSKWERGLGCPDVSLLHDLSLILNVNIEKILSGELNSNDQDGGNMKRIRFYVCPKCNNIITSSSDAEISCCGRKLEPLIAKPADDNHRLVVENIEEDYYITFNHAMTKEHYINFVAYVTDYSILLVKLYPEGGNEVRFPRMYGGKIFFNCVNDGLYVQ